MDGVKRWKLHVFDRYPADGSGERETHADMRECMRGKFVQFEDHEAELAALREELAETKSRSTDFARSFNNQCRKTDDLYQRLTAAEQRNAELAASLQKCAADLSGIGSFLKSFHEENESQWCGYLDDALGAARYRHSEVIAALKPTESGASE